MAVKIKLARMGKIREPHYRIVIADARNRRDGRVIETIGEYHPKSQPSDIRINSERAQYWLGVGAIPTDPVHGLLKVTGDWQKFKGEPAPAPMKVAAPKPDKKAIYEEAARASMGEPAAEATTPKKKAAPKAEAAPAAAETPAAAEAPAAEPAAAEAAPAAETPAE